VFERPDGRTGGQLRKVTLTPGYLRHAEGSCVVAFGETRVLCAATVTAGVPSWRRGSGEGWVTAEYAMLPRSGIERTSRDAQKGGRASEIQRLVGRSLRAAIDLRALGEHTITVDCDVIEADGGTRTAAVTGGMVALAQAVDHLRTRGMVRTNPLRSSVAAISVGMVETEPLLDLCYAEDVRAEVDMNVVMTARGDFVEVQGTAEGVPYSRKDLNAMLALAGRGVKRLIRMQQDALTKAGVGTGEGWT
jgi:ribonuclease PH